MAFDVVVSDVAEFQRWLNVQAEPAGTLADGSARGRDAFFAHGCTACHAIRGTPAVARIGPDLTHVAGRLRIGAGTLPNDGGSLARWIGQTDRIKPGVHMPAFRGLAPEEVTALAAYLSTLR
jgi:cytochrome c oxidase subunit 2